MKCYNEDMKFSKRLVLSGSGELGELNELEVRTIAAIAPC